MDRLSTVSGGTTSGIYLARLRHDFFVARQPVNGGGSQYRLCRTEHEDLVVGQFSIDRLRRLGEAVGHVGII